MRKILSLSLLMSSIGIAIASSPALNPSTTFSFDTYSIKRNSIESSNITYFVSKPRDVTSYPIVIMVGGSTDKQSLDSIVNFQHYFESDLNNNHLGTLAVDKWGIDHQMINESVVMTHYTRTQIFNDYQQVIDYIQKNPPKGWNGKFAVLGVSEGGPIAEKLAENNKDIQAVVLWSGAIDSSWRDTLWLDMHQIYNDVCIPLKMPVADCYDVSNKDKFESRINLILNNQSSESYFFNMTNMYVADGVTFSRPDYTKLANHNVLVVTGVKDTIITSSDDFYKKAKQNHVKIDYWRIDGMDHKIRNHPDLINNTFIWLKQQLSK